MNAKQLISTTRPFFVFGFVIGSLLLVYASRWLIEFHSLAEFALFLFCVLIPILLAGIGVFVLVKGSRATAFLWGNSLFWVFLSIAELAEDITKMHIHRPFPFIMSIFSLFCICSLLIGARQAPSPMMP